MNYNLLVNNFTKASCKSANYNINKQIANNVLIINKKQNQLFKGIKQKFEN